MKHKGVVILLTVLITALSIYFLSFTLVTGDIREQANVYATDSTGNIDLNKRQGYLDSIWKKPVYNLLGLGIEYTYQEVKETELSLGLDLQGGMHVTLEVSPIDIIKALSGDNQDPLFLQAIERAKEKQRTSQSEFVDLFYESFQEASPNSTLGPLFANANNRGRISSDTPDGDILDIINTEVELAIGRSFNILRNRIDRFGASQPTIQRIEGTGRIQIELPGVENKERVRKMLQSVAKLEFWEVADDQDVFDALGQASQILADEKKGTTTDDVLDDLLDSTQVADVADAIADTLTDGSDTTLLANNAGDSAGFDLSDTSANADSARADVNFDDLDVISRNFRYFSQIPRESGGGYLLMRFAVKDTIELNRAMARPEIKDLFPSDVVFLWDAKGEVLEGVDDELIGLTPVRLRRGGKAPLEGDVVTNAYQDYDERGAPAVTMVMNFEGAKTWRNLTAENINRRIAVVLDDYVYSAPNVSVEIPNGRSIITGSFDIQQAQDLASILKAGALPAPTRIVEEAVVGPTLGAKARQQGIISMLAGLGIVIIFMIAYYSGGGAIANLALAFNVFFILGILANINAALTLPGIAGIVLTIGMSIDANVLIFERIREELRNGSNLKNAINAGYKKAFTSIFDANMTTALTAVILYWLGQGPVQGFAITLLIGIACSFFSAVYITRVFIERLSRKGDDSKISFKTPLSKGVLANLDFNFLGKRKRAYIFSVSFIAIGMILLVVQGGFNFGVDFKGGRSYVVEFPEAVSSTDLKVALADDFDNKGTEVKTFGSSNTVKVTTSYLVDDESAEADSLVQLALVSGLQEATSFTYTANENTRGPDNFIIGSSSKVGATIADDIQKSSIYSILLALVVIFAYIFIRFRKWQFGIGAIIALFHDTFFVGAAFSIVGFLGIKSFEVDQVVIAAVLTMIGYSINDTVVVFDRVRENLRLNTKKDKNEVFNISINNTLNRTVITSVTTLIVILVLLIFGGEVLRGFSFSLLVGVLIGTYSSVFIATPMVIDLPDGSKKES